MNLSRCPSLRTETASGPTLMDRVRLFVWVLLVLLMTSGEALAREPVIYLQGSGNPVFNQRFTELLTEHLGPGIRLEAFSPEMSHLRPNAPIITLGPEALGEVVEAAPGHPLVALLVNRQLISALLTGGEPRLTALYYDPPLLRQALIGRAILPQATRVAILARPDEVVRYDRLIRELAVSGLEARVFMVSGDDVLIQALTRALSFGDFLLATPDEFLYNPHTIKHILLTTYRRNRLVIGPSQAFVRAGALASSYAPLTDYAEEAAALISHYLDTGELLPPAYPVSFDIDVNHQVARSLNIPLPDDAQLVEEVLQLLESNRRGDRP